MKFYLAGVYHRRKELLGYRRELEAMGHTSTSTWLCENFDKEDDEAIKTHKLPAQARQESVKDVNDVMKADAMISFYEPKRNIRSSRGGRHIEFGVAIASQKRLIVIGVDEKDWDKNENIFYVYPGVEHYTSWNEWKLALAKEFEVPPLTLVVS
jgi:nucleoside 2-deoxyribosyltransferase